MSRKNWQPLLGITTLILVGMLFLAACNGAPSSASAGPHDPPPPQGPPLTTDGLNADGELQINLIRSILQTEGDTVIADFNADSDHELSWSSGARPTQCGYDCVGPPIISTTRFLDQPNQYVATLRARFDFNLDIENVGIDGTDLVPFDRTIRTNISIQVACSGWRDGSGEIQVLTRNDPPFIVDDTGLVEDTLDFLLLPVNLSGSINARIENQLSSGGSGELDFSRVCRSLGVNSNFSTGASQFDSIFWEEPETSSVISLLPNTFEAEHIVVTLQSIKRNNTTTLMDTSAGVFFDIYFNGQLIWVPSSDTVQIAPGDELTLDDVFVRIPSKDLADLQIIFADSLGGSGWMMFDREDDYGEGGRTLPTHRTEVQPADSIPLPTELPGSNKPVKVDLHEFELVFEMDYVPQPVLTTSNE
jgi:hypothetical protein